MHLSGDRERTGVIDIGLKSLGCAGFDTLRDDRCFPLLRNNAICHGLVEQLGERCCKNWRSKSLYGHIANLIGIRLTRGRPGFNPACGQVFCIIFFSLSMNKRDLCSKVSKILCFYVFFSTQCTLYVFSPFLCLISVRC